jgi:hypothetical protein
MFRQRPDGTYVEGLPAFRRIIPYLIRTRAEATVYFPQRIEVDELLAWLARTNEGRPEAERITLFHVLLTAIARAVKLRPEVNRFVIGRRTYEHKDISISFVVKTAATDEAPETEVRLVFTGDETVEQVRDLVRSQVEHKRTTQGGSDDRLVDFFASWPRPVLELIAGAIARLDYHNALPEALRDAIPLYTSVYMLNAGSIGIDPPFHYLYRYGSASVFVAIGALRKEAVVDEHDQVVARSCVNAVYSLDDRASDGFYFARTAEVFRRLVAHPLLLEKQDITVDEILGHWPRRG